MCLVPPGAFPVVAATPPAFMAPPGTAPLPPAPQPPPQVTQVSNIILYCNLCRKNFADLAAYFILYIILNISKILSNTAINK